MMDRCRLRQIHPTKINKEGLVLNNQRGEQVPNMLFPALRHASCHRGLENVSTHLIAAKSLKDRQ